MLRGEHYVLWRAADEHGAELDILLQKRRDTTAAERFFKRILRSCLVPRRIVTDQLRSYPAAKSRIPELANVKHVFVKAAARVNNRAENSHQPTRERERRLRGFRDPKRTQALLSSFGPIRQHFALKRHLLRASFYRKQLAQRFDAWHRFTELAQIPSARLSKHTSPEVFAPSPRQRDSALGIPLSFWSRPALVSFQRLFAPPEKMSPSQRRSVKQG
jgi:putative transposase